MPTFSTKKGKKKKNCLFVVFWGLLRSEILIVWSISVEFFLFFFFSCIILEYRQVLRVYTFCFSDEESEFPEWEMMSSRCELL